MPAVMRRVCIRDGQTFPELHQFLAELNLIPVQPPRISVHQSDYSGTDQGMNRDNTILRSPGLYTALEISFFQNNLQRLDRADPEAGIDKNQKKTATSYRFRSPARKHWISPWSPIRRSKARRRARRSCLRLATFV